MDPTPLHERSPTVVRGHRALYGKDAGAVSLRQVLILYTLADTGVSNLLLQSVSAHCLN